MLSQFIDKLKRNGRGRNDKEAGSNRRRRKRERKRERDRKEEGEKNREKERKRQGGNFGKGNCAFVSAHIQTANRVWEGKKLEWFLLWITRTKWHKVKAEVLGMLCARVCYSDYFSSRNP